MQETQLACPHCGSTLNFGTAIAAGTPVECLICMRTFTAQPLPAQPHAVKVETPAAHVPAAQPAPVPIAQPAPTAVTAKPAAKSPPPIGKPVRPSAPRIRRPEEAAAATGKFALIAVTLGLLLVLGGGVSVVVWKIASAVRHGGDSQFVLDPGADPQKDPEQPGNNGDPAKGDAQTKKANNNIEEIDDDALKIKAAEKKLLVRKKPSSEGGGPEIDWTVPINIEQQKTYVGLTQKSINQAIEKGIFHLRKTQTPNGTWSQAYPVGHAAISGLTLLECGAPPHDPTVQRAAHFVRANVLPLDFTYELSLAILFLDRLGEPRDRALVQGMALRLLAGQNDCGGWTYNCPLLNSQEMYQLYVFLHSNRQPNLLNPLFGTSADRRNMVGAGEPKPREATGTNDAFGQFGSLLAKGADTVPDAKNNPAVKTKKTAPLRPEWLKANLQNIPVVRNQGKGKGKQRLANGAGDNSNTQFALLALWAARRHDIPSEQAIMAAYQRFVTTQNKDGGWGYSINHSVNTTDAMTAVGLLGLAMGHGTAPDVVKFDPKNPKDTIVRPALDDANIQNGLKTLSRHIGAPVVEGDAQNLPMQNLYWMWSIERVAMLYDLKTINGKEWYPWGAQILVHRQDADGSWGQSNYPGSDPNVNTCFALLFLKRSNLVQDLTANLRLYTGIRDPEK